MITRTLCILTSFGLLSCSEPQVIAESDQQAIIDRYFDSLEKPDGTLEVDKTSRFVLRALEGTPYSVDDFWHSVNVDASFNRRYKARQGEYLTTESELTPWEEAWPPQRGPREDWKP